MTERKRLSVIPGYRDVYCQLCGLGPRVSLARHVKASHDGVKEYKRQFGPQSLISADLRFNKRASWDDRVEDDTVVIFRRPKLCDNGHRLAGKNVVHNGKYRRCRKCLQEWNRQRTWKNRPAWRRRQRKCHWCSTSYLPTHKAQKFCCRKCSSHATRKPDNRRRSTLPDSHQHLWACAWCGTEFKPKRVKQITCCPKCYDALKWNAGKTTKQRKQASG